MPWDKCQECGGELIEKPGEEYVNSTCVKCGTQHGWDDDNGWFSFGRNEKQEENQ